MMDLIPVADCKFVQTLMNETVRHPERAAAVSLDVNGDTGAVVLHVKILLDPREFRNACLSYLEENDREHYMTRLIAAQQEKLRKQVEASGGSPAPTEE